MVLLLWIGVHNRFLDISTRLLHCQTEEEYRLAVEQNVDLLVQVGIGAIFSQSLENRSSLLRDLLMHFLFYR